ncbi:MAG: UTP--glucose-1-phosphate uridylyltransferase [Methanobacteriota archaeon]|nr:MAG: UTP--glucose-1-phosphate uridylyltransferase [Euryarchaeota archaeon]
MQVIVLAGGFGSRLAPWTSHVPKPLLPMLDKTLVERVLDLLPIDEVDRVIIAAGYRVNDIKNYFDSLKLPFEIIVQPEKEPLGTGGAIANCKDFITDTFLVINGDLITSVDIKSLVNEHKKAGVLATISLFEVEDPTRFGVVKLTNEDKIIQFQEKPTLEEAFSNLINAGTYVLEPEIFDIMPSGAHSMERDVFTKIAPLGEMLGFEFDGYFVDAGTPPSWLESCRTCFLDNRWDLGEKQGNNWIGVDSIVIGANLIDSFISNNCILEKSTIVNSCVLKNVRIKGGCSLRNTLVGENAKIGENCDLENVIVDYNAIVPDGWKQSGGRYPNQ